MTQFLENINPQILNFIIVVLFSFSIGMERSKKTNNNTSKFIFGTDRTFTLVGILGYLLLVAGGDNMVPYFIGFIVIGLLMCVFYYSNISINNYFGLTSIILVLITYGFPLFIAKMSLWLSLVLFVTVLILSEVKKPLRKAIVKIDDDEFSTIAKFMIITGIILPILPHEEIHPNMPVSPYNIWLAVVVVSVISYVSYLLKKYVFPKSGLLLTAILGGLYSSTASTFILARKSKDDDKPYAYAGAIIIATSMMFFRIYILIAIFIPKILLMSLLYFLFLFLTSLFTGIYIYRLQNKNNKIDNSDILEDKNPLEFKVALVFSGLYLLFSVITNFVLTNFGQSGLSILSVFVGLGDIAPFLLNLFQGSYDVTFKLILIATLQAMAGNNIIKAIYAITLGNKKIKGLILKGFGVISAFNILAVVIAYWV